MAFDGTTYDDTGNYSADYLAYLNSELRTAFHSYPEPERKVIRDTMQRVFTAEGEHSNDIVSRWTRENPPTGGRSYDFIGRPNGNTYPKQYTDSRGSNRVLSFDERQQTKIAFATAVINGAPTASDTIPHNVPARDQEFSGGPELDKNKLIDYLSNGRDIFRPENGMQPQFRFRPSADPQHAPAEVDLIFRDDSPNSPGPGGNSGLLWDDYFDLAG